MMLAVIALAKFDKSPEVVVHPSGTNHHHSKI